MLADFLKENKIPVVIFGFLFIFVLISPIVTNFIILRKSLFDVAGTSVNWIMYFASIFSTIATITTAFVTLFLNFRNQTRKELSSLKNDILNLAYDNMNDYNSVYSLQYKKEVKRITKSKKFPQLEKPLLENIRNVNKYLQQYDNLIQYKSGFADVFKIDTNQIVIDIFGELSESFKEAYEKYLNNDMVYKKLTLKNQQLNHLFVDFDHFNHINQSTRDLISKRLHKYNLISDNGNFIVIENENNLDDKQKTLALNLKEDQRKFILYREELKSKTLGYINSRKKIIEVVEKE
jgi:mRNA-degrading endonuclease HigB of HigAB toxin-antitoxin module